MKSEQWIRDTIARLRKLLPMGKNANGIIDMMIDAEIRTLLEVLEDEELKRSYTS